MIFFVVILTRKEEVTMLLSGNHTFFFKLYKHLFIDMSDLKFCILYVSQTPI